MSKTYFGMTQIPLGKEVKNLWDDGQQLKDLTEKFQWLLDSPGIGLLTGEPGVGKTATLKHLTQGLNPQRYYLVYMSETDFGRTDLYYQLALSLGLEPPRGRANLWRAIKARVLDLYDGKNVLPVWILDESQNLPKEFFRDLPSFLNFSFDSRDIFTIWLVGHPLLSHLMERVPYAALAGRISARVSLKPIMERERFAALVEHGFREAGCNIQLLSNSGIEMLRQASQGRIRPICKILENAMRIATLNGVSHLPDEILHAAITALINTRNPDTHRMP